MESQKPQFDVLQAAEGVMQDAQLVEHGVELEPFVVLDLMKIATDAQERRAAGKIYEPLLEGGPDIADELVEKMTHALPQAREGNRVAVQLNNPHIKFIRELLEEEQQNRRGDTVQKIEHESDVISFENAVEDSLRYEQNEESTRKGGFELTDRGREMAARLLEERKKYPRRINVRSGGSLSLQWKLAAYLEEEQIMRPKYSPEFDDSYEVGKKTLSAFGKGKTIEKDDRGVSRLTEVILTREQIDFLSRNLTALLSGVENEQAKQIRELVEGVARSFDTAPLVLPREGKLRKFFNKFTGQK